MTWRKHNKYLCFVTNPCFCAEVRSEPSLAPSKGSFWHPFGVPLVSFWCLGGCLGSVLGRLWGYPFRCLFCGFSGPSPPPPQKLRSVARARTSGHHIKPHLARKTIRYMWGNTQLAKVVLSRAVRRGGLLRPTSPSSLALRVEGLSSEKTL